MSLKEKINSEMVVAAKAKDSLKLGTIRMIKTALHNKEIDAKRDLNDAEILQVLSSIVKQRKDSIEQFKAGNRQDLVDKEEYELQVVQAFMPQQMSAEEVEAGGCESHRRDRGHEFQGHGEGHEGPHAQGGRKGRRQASERYRQSETFRLTGRLSPGAYQRASPVDRTRCSGARFSKKNGPSLYTFPIFIILGVRP